jgi:hypothetical protein
VVEKVYPSADVLPANHLRFHIRFSRPMRGGKEIFEQIRILDDKGKQVQHPWLRDDLWDAEGRSLILYIHPGRIKWGVLLRLLFGPVLEPGRAYTLVIGPEMRDAAGRRLGRAFKKKFTTLAEDRTRVELSAWKLRAPDAGTRKSLVLSFPTVLDRLALNHRLKVVDAGGKEIAGRVEVGAGERSWSFRPAGAWEAAAYRVEVDPELEDVAGNTPLSPFDVDLDTPKRPPQRLSLPFRPRAAARIQGGPAK